MGARCLLIENIIKSRSIREHFGALVAADLEAVVGQNRVKKINA
jgi:hypothetical protein